MPTREELFRQFEGEIVPREIHGGFIVLSYAISFMGALSTLELMKRRTARKGLFNYVLLLGASVTMGGVAIWCMHFIGSRAIILAHNEVDLQIAYSTGFTVLSFFVPILVLFLAFIFVGVGDGGKSNWVRVIFSGSLAGMAICGMHYLGNASIANYHCVYNPGYVVGSAIIAVVASVVAMSVFFVFRNAWADSWWKTLASGILLAGAVSGMHWCAAMGTQFRLRAFGSGSGISINKTIIVVIILSVVTCLLMAGTAIWTARARMQMAKKAQQVVLAAAVFDSHGRILVDRNGLLPSEGVTDTFLDRATKDKFDTNHPLFHWMFRVSRNWPGIQPLLDGMAAHISSLPRQGRDRDARENINLVSENGEVVDKYDVIFRELFCVAAAALAVKMKEHVSDVGVLWEDILTTGSGAVLSSGRVSHETNVTDDSDPKQMNVHMKDIEQGLGGSKKKKSGNGSLMFLVRKVESDVDVERLGAAGYRFVDLNQAVGFIASTMHIKNADVNAKFRAMATYTDAAPTMQPGVHVSFFGIRPKRHGANHDILVRKEAKSLLPSIRLPLEKLSGWHKEFLLRLDGMTPAEMEKAIPTWKGLSKKETSVSGRLLDAVQDLRAWVGDRVFEDATLSPEVFEVPCSNGGSGGQATATLIALRLVIPTNAQVVSANCTFIPLSLFKILQLTSRGSPHHQAFSRAVHRELAPIINAMPNKGNPETSRLSLVPKPAPSRLSKFKRMGRGGAAADGGGSQNPAAFGDGGLRPQGLNRSTSTLKLWERSSMDQSGPESPYDAAPATNLSMLGGIMISEEITVNVCNERTTTTRTSNHSSDEDSSTRGSVGDEQGDAIEMGELHGTTTMRVANVEAEQYSELVTFVDELYGMCMRDKY